MRRRDILAGAGSLATAATLSFPAPAIAQGIRQLKMVTDWPAGSPGLQSSAARLAQRIGAASGGRINIEVFPAGALVRPFETFDAVGAGVAEMYHSAEYYWEKKSPAFGFFAAVPFGFTANELFAWVQYGGGQELWDALSGQFNIKPFLCCNTGTQMGGWCTREVPSLGVFRGLRYRMPGLHRSEHAGRRDRAVAQVRRHRRQRMGRALARLGSGSPQGRELLLLSRLPRAGHRPDAWHQQARVGELRREQPAGHRGRDCGRIHARPGGVQRQQCAGVVAGAGSGDDLSRKIYASYQQFLPLIIDWSDIAEGAVLNSRRFA
jgi:TRAP-type mannitol/chloroaromatic compound transport system substrate-binding protein